MSNAGEKFHQATDNPHHQGIWQTDNQSLHGQDDGHDQGKQELTAKEGGPDNIQFSEKLPVNRAECRQDQFLKPIKDRSAVFDQVEGDDQDEYNP